jgi:hypothetical protein
LMEVGSSSEDEGEVTFGAGGADAAPSLGGLNNIALQVSGGKFLRHAGVWLLDKPAWSLGRSFLPRQKQLRDGHRRLGYVPEPSRGTGAGFPKYRDEMATEGKSPALETEDWD